MLDIGDGAGASLVAGFGSVPPRETGATARTAVSVRTSNRGRPAGTLPPCPSSRLFLAFRIRILIRHVVFIGS
jgi:hypothetical protein